jgi:hypothetical protein
MAEHAKKARYIAGALFVTLFLLWGSGYNTFGVFSRHCSRNFTGPTLRFRYAQLQLCSSQARPRHSPAGSSSWLTCAQ